MIEGSHGENRGSSPLGSAKQILKTQDRIKPGKNRG
jgi:hypothetical protein